MAQLVKVVKYFDDGTETAQNFVPNPNAQAIEQAVKDNSMGEVTDTEISSEISEVTSNEDEAEVEESDEVETEEVEELSEESAEEKEEIIEE